MMLTNWLQNFQSRYPGSAASARRNRHFHPAQVAISNDVERLEDKCMLSSVLISIEKPIATATDDAEERETESVSRFDSTLDIPDRGGKDQIIGLRFTDVEIPEDAVIRRAYVQFTADGNSSGTANVNIRGELSSESETFAGTSGDLSLRTRTNTAINWSPSDWLLNGDQTSAQATPDLTPIIQELINQADWSSDSAITFLMEGDGTRNARAFDAGSGAPVLHIDYIVDANYYEKEYLVVHTPRLQQGNVALDGFGFAGTDKDQIQIMMQTQRTGNNNVNDTLMLEYRKVGATNWNTGTWSTTSAGQSGVELHTASLTGLDYGTEYEYRVRQYIESGELVEEWEATFQTRLAKGDATEFSFAAFGNSSANPVGNDDILANTRQLMERLGTTDARFSLLVGNSINPNGSYSDADGRFEYFINPEGAEWLGSHVEYTAYGPDEINSGAADLYYSNPEIIEGVTSPFYNPVGEQLEENYSFDYGDTHFATFNSNVWDNEAQLNEVLDWLEKDMLGSTAQWKIVYTNYPVAGPSGSGIDPSSNYFDEAVERLHAAGVDLLLTGESGTYSWTKPLLGASNGEAVYVDDQDQTYDKGAGLIQVTSGVGGYQLDAGSFATQDYIAAGYSSTTARPAEVGFSYIEVREDALIVKYVAADNGEVIDSFTITDEKYSLPSAVNIDGDFSDWASIPSYYDPLDDVHDTDTEGRDGEPAYREHPDVDLLEYKVTHDNENLYFYFRAAGEIGETQVANPELGHNAGRYYVIVTIDVDDNNETGYWLDEGGYYPTTNGYDMNAEIEFYNGEFNTGHYINHGAVDDPSLLEAFQEQTADNYIPGYDGPYKPGYIEILPGSYDYYTQWVYDDKGTKNEFDDEITFVVDRGPIIQGNISGAGSADGREFEMVAPLLGFMKDKDGNPIVDFGSILDISFSLEASGELAPDQDWGSDTGTPINGYVVTETPLPQSSFGFGATPMVLEDSGFHSIANFMTINGGANREFVISNNNEHLFSEQPEIDFETGTLTFSTAPDQWGVSTVSVTELLDGQEVETRKFNIYIKAQNDPPNAVDDFTEVYSNTWDNPIDVLPNDTVDPDIFENITITNVQQLTDNGGTVEFVNGQLFYTPKPTFTGVDTFEYTIADNTGLTDTATVQVTVTPAPLPSIVIDGNMSDWDNPYINTYFDPEDDQHDTDTEGQNNTPTYVDHPDVDLLDFRVTNDDENLYFYFRSRGQIGRTTNAATDGSAGRYYVIVTIDVDNDDATGYWLDDGGYYPTTNGYDMNAEVEYYDGTFNTGHYLNHGARNDAELYQAFLDQTQGDYQPGFDGPYKPGFVDILPGDYDYYSQWVYQENDPSTEADDQIVLVRDRGPVVLGNITAAISPDGHSLEMIAPMKGFLKDENGVPIVDIGSVLDLSFSLEASGQFSANGRWASDTADPINGYVVGEPQAVFPYSEDFDTNSADQFIPVTGNWTAGNGEWTVDARRDFYRAGISILDAGTNLPDNFILSSQMNITPQSGQASNGFLIFDYESPVKFKFAGLAAGQNKVIIGQYENGRYNFLAEAPQTLNINTDYDVELRVEGSHVSLSLDGLTRISHTFGDVINDDPLGIGANNSTVHFDNFAFQTLLDGTMKTPFPFSMDDGDDLEGTMYTVNGNWTIEEDFAIGNSIGLSNPLGVALFNTEFNPPPNYFVSTRINSTFQGPGTANNAFIVFDYESPTKFKFAGMAVGQNQWVIGEYNNGWKFHSTFSEQINVNQFYNVDLEISGSTARLFRDGVQVTSHTFNSTIYDGLAGLFVNNGESRFENIELGNGNSVSTNSTSGGFDLEGTMSTVNGNWTIEEDFAIGNSVGLSNPHGVALFNTEFNPPQNYFVSTRMNSTFQGPGTANNAFIVFDYESPTKFKFAGMAVGQNQWVIGEYNNGWKFHSTFSEQINVNQFYDVDLEISGSTATLFRDGVQVTSHTFNSTVYDGLAGLFVNNGESRFENIKLGAASLGAHSQFTDPLVSEVPMSDSVFEGALDDLLV